MNSHGITQKHDSISILPYEKNILLIHETKTTDAADDHCTASSDYRIPPTNNIYICNV